MEPLRGRVQKVQKVQKVLPASSRRVQRVWYRLTAMSIYAAFGSENHKTGPAARRKCTPSAYGTFPRESVSRDFQVAVLPYKSRSLATPEGEVCSPLSF